MVAFIDGGNFDLYRFQICTEPYLAEYQQNRMANLYHIITPIIYDVNVFWVCLPN